MLSVRFWGVRGSIPCPGPNTVVYGGNTSCLEIRANEKLVIVDLGTGVRPLGDWLIANDFKRRGKIDADVFITHTHWDHIMGFPMFTPIFLPSATLRIRGPASYEDDTLESIIGAQLSYRYWPVRLSELRAHLEYDQIRETTIDLSGGLTVKTKYLNHPIFCLGYRFEYEGTSIVTAYDTEPFHNVFPIDPLDPNYDENAATEGEDAAKEGNERMLQFFQDADILIHDCQYTEKEYKGSKIGWGHSSYEHAIDYACKANIKKLVMFHHDPNRTDEQLTELEANYKALIKEKSPLEIIMAREGLTLKA